MIITQRMSGYLLVGTMLLCSGEATAQAAVSDAVLFGRLTIAKGYPDKGLAIFLIITATKGDIKIEFQKSMDGIAVVRVPAGKYRIDDNRVLISAPEELTDDQRTSIRSMVDIFKRGFELKAGDAVYFGDLIGFTNLAYGGSKVAIVNMYYQLDQTKKDATKADPALSNYLVRQFQ